MAYVISYNLLNKNSQIMSTKISPGNLITDNKKKKKQKKKTKKKQDSKHFCKHLPGNLVEFL